MYKKIILFSSFLLVFSTKAQYGISGGLCSLKPFGVETSYFGFNVAGEFPRDNEVSFHLRASFYSKRKLMNTTQSTIFLEALDPNNFNIQTANTQEYFNYTTIDGGLRYYILDGYDNGFALYGGTNVMGIINKAKIKVDAFDDSQYRIPTNTSLNGTILSLAAGFSGGAKYTFPGIGSVFADLTFDYLLTAIPSNQTAQTIGGSNLSSILFTFSVGFRKDLY